MDIKDLIVWSWRHKWWFVGSLALCLALGMLYFFSKTPVYSVRSAIMIRTPDVQTQQGELMTLMGADANKMASDEIEMLTSRDLMEQIVDSLHLSIVVEKRKNLRWLPVYPCPDFALQYGQQPVRKTTTIRVKEDSVKYRITIYPRIASIDMNMEKVKVNRLDRESQVIVLTQATTNPAQAIDVLNMLLDLYNQADSKDRNKIALQSQTFLDGRLAEVQSELNEIEVELERFKIDYQVTDLAETALQYRSRIEDYQIELSDISLSIRELDNLDYQLKDSAVLRKMSGLFTNIKMANINGMCGTYNSDVNNRISLIRSAKENNPVIQSLDYRLDEQLANIQRACNELRSLFMVRQKYLSEQIQKYSTLLAQLPEQERTYVMLKREKATKEEQYIYLIQKKEENILTLHSSALPVKVVEAPRISAKRLSPNLLYTVFAVVVLGMFLPLGFYFYRRFKEEYIS